MDLYALLASVLSGGTVIYLIVSKLFSKKRDAAEAHQAAVVSFDAEMSAIRKIKLDMIEDVQTMQKQVKDERAKITSTISGELNALKERLEQEHLEAAKREERLNEQFVILEKTVQAQATQLNKMVMYWQLLCDKDCNNRHVPLCPLNDMQ